MTRTAAFYLSSLSKVAEIDRCRTFVSEVLSAGNALAKAITEQQDRFVKFYTTIAAAATTTDFWSGGWSSGQTVLKNGVAAEPIVSNDEFAIDLLQAYVAEAPTNVCILENTSARRGDPFIVRMKSTIAYVDESVLHVINHGASNRRVADALREAKGVPVFVGVASEIPRAWRDGLVENSEVPREALRDVVGSARILLVGAYDGEGYVIGVPRS